MPVRYHFGSIRQCYSIIVQCERCSMMFDTVDCSEKFTYFLSRQIFLEHWIEWPNSTRIERNRRPQQRQPTNTRNPQRHNHEMIKWLTHTQTHVHGWPSTKRRADQCKQITIHNWLGELMSILFEAKTIEFPMGKMARMFIPKVHSSKIGVISESEPVDFEIIIRFIMTITCYGLRCLHLILGIAHCYRARNIWLRT